MLALTDFPFIIVEGTDGTGKTTLANELGLKLNRPVLHASAPTHDNWIDEYIQPLIDHEETGAILDRWHLGESVWPFIFDRAPLFPDGDAFIKADEIIASIGAINIVLVRNPNEIVNELFFIRDEPEVAVRNAIRGQTLFTKMDVKMERYAIFTSLPMARELFDLE